LHLTPERLFDPCTNLRSGAALLSAMYSATTRIQGEGFDALDSALSYYNSGSPTTGITNGYVQQVKTHAMPSKHER
jgi:type IV secretion system protein VirB1